MIIGGAFGDISAHSDLSATVSYIFDDIAWCTAITKPVPRWQNLFFVMTASMWITFVVSSYFVTLFLYKLIKYDSGTYYSFHVIAMVVMQSVLGLPSIFNPRNSGVRVFYAMLMLANIVAINTYLAFYIKIMTVPMHLTQVETIEEIISYGYELCGQNETLSFYNHQQDSVSIAV